jgi:lambda repressor-like predicted transcriptional regulator
MKKKLKYLGLALGIAALLTLTLGTTVFADNGDAPAAGTYCGGYGWHGFQDEQGTCTETVSELLGLTTDEICDLRQDGSSLADIAAANGVTLEELVNAVMADKIAAVEALVADGTITQEQADLMISRMAERTEDMVTSTTTGQAQWRMGGGSGMAGQGTCAGSANRWSARSAGSGGMSRWGTTR